MISCSIFFASIVFSMNIAAWLATDVMTSRSFGWNCASDSLSSHRTPSTSFSLSCRSGTTMALEIRFRIIDLPFEAAKSIDASCVSTPARSLMTWLRMVLLTWMGASLPSRRRAARGCSCRRSRAGG